MHTHTLNPTYSALNQDIAQFEAVFPITADMSITYDGVSRLVMLDRYAFKDTAKKTLKVGDFVLLTVKEDPKYPARGTGIVTALDWETGKASIAVSDDYKAAVDTAVDADGGTVIRDIATIDKPLELFYEQIAMRNAHGLAAVETSQEKRNEAFLKFYAEQRNKQFIPAGRVLYGAGSGTDVTFFNCFSGDTIVQTKNGPKLIKDLNGEHEVYSMDGEIRKAFFKSYGTQELYEITLQNGEKIKTTAGHEWYAYNRKQNNLQKVSTLELEGKKIPIIKKDLARKHLNPKEVQKGIQNGIVYGDGTLAGNDSSCVLLFGEKKDLAKWFDSDMVTPHYNEEYVRVSRLPAAYKSLPSEDATESFWYGFVIGLIAADGCCDSRGSTAIHQSDAAALEYIAKHLHKTPFAYSDISVTRELSPFTGQYAPCYSLQLVKSTMVKEDFLKKSHYEKYKNSPHPRKANIEVVSVRKLGYSEEVFCCEEPETRSFVIGTGYLTSNCYVMPFIPDSRGGISEHRKQVMEIMSRGGGVGTNGSTLRPKHALARGVNGRSSGAVSWLDDLAKLTHLVEQGGSRRGAQMIMLADWHPDILEFIISKMQNPRILRYIIENFADEQIRALAHKKLKFTPFTPSERDLYQGIVNYKNFPGQGGFTDAVLKEAEIKLRDGGTYAVNDPEFLTGANISVCITDDFMQAVKEDRDYALRFPDVNTYDADEMAVYDAEWARVGDVREWEKGGNRVATHRTIKAQELWKLITVCATYAAEPGIFFIDNANNMTNATAYGQKVVATNPCGEQPLAPYSVCNLAAVNLAEMVDKDSQKVDFEKLKKTVRMGVHMQDNVIDSTPYFLEHNRKQALGERRIGLGIMGLADMLIYCGIRYGSEAGNQLIDQVFKAIAVTAYEESIALAKERGSFPFLIGKNGKETQLLREKFVNTGFMKGMPAHVREGVLKHGIRNSHLLTVAPTGSTGTMAGVSTGLEPYFSFSYFRSGRLGKFIEVKAAIVQEYLDRNPGADPHNLPDYFVAAMDLAPEAHVDVQTTIQRWVDSSISKTVNAPKGYSVEQVQKIYERLYYGGAKGGTVYVDGSRDSQVLTLKAEENAFESVAVSPEKALEKDSNKDKAFVVDTIVELDTTAVTIGNEIGDTCPVCRIGTVQDLGGCNTCNNCAAQLKCGL